MRARSRLAESAEEPSIRELPLGGTGALGRGGGGAWEPSPLLADISLSADMPTAAPPSASRCACPAASSSCSSSAVSTAAAGCTTPRCMGCTVCASEEAGLDSPPACCSTSDSAGAAADRGEPATVDACSSSAVERCSHCCTYSCLLLLSCACNGAGGRAGACACRSMKEAGSLDARISGAGAGAGTLPPPGSKPEGPPSRPDGPANRPEGPAAESSEGSNSAGSTMLLERRCRCRTFADTFSPSDAPLGGRCGPAAGADGCAPAACGAAGWRARAAAAACA